MGLLKRDHSRMGTERRQPAVIDLVPRFDPDPALRFTDMAHHYQTGEDGAGHYLTVPRDADPQFTLALCKNRICSRWQACAEFTILRAEGMMLGVARPSANVATNQSTTGTSFSNAEFWGMDQDGEISHSVSGDRDDWTWRDGGPLNPGGIRQGGGYVGYQVRGWCYPFQGEGDGEWFGNGDVMRLLLDADAGTLTVKKNGELLGVAFTGLTGGLCWAVACHRWERWEWGEDSDEEDSDGPSTSVRITAVDPAHF